LSGTAKEPTRESAKEPAKEPAMSPASDEPVRHSEQSVAAADLHNDDSWEDLEDNPAWRSRAAMHAMGGWFLSMIAHAVAILVLALVVNPEPIRVVLRELVAEPLPDRDEDILKLDLDDQLMPSQELAEAASAANGDAGPNRSADVGGPAGFGGVSAPRMDAAVLDQLADEGLSVDSPTFDVLPGRRLIVAVPDTALGDPRAIVKDYQQAMDLITQEILNMLYQSKVLVVWCFDQSESMKDDQQEIRQRIDRVYVELGIEDGTRGDALDTVVTSFGQSFAVHTRRPTHNLREIREAIDAVPVDPSGKEMMCEAVGLSIAQFRDSARRTDRQMALILVTDESGDPESNQSRLEAAIAEAKTARCRVYVLGREAVFGYPYAHMRWVHPQTGATHWLQIDRGPETATAEQLQTDGFHRRYDAHPSGFGSYEQTRLARQTGGIFFMLPSLEVNLVGGEKRHYELDQMRPYLPDLRARDEVMRDIAKWPLRAGLTRVIYDLNPYVPEIAKIIEMRVAFAPQPDNFVQQAQLEMAKAITYLAYLGKVEDGLKKLEPHRRREVARRWEANFDLFSAQVIAYQARMFEYGAYLEWFLNHPKQVPLTKPPNLFLSHWQVRTRSEILVPKKSQPYIDRATELFQAVIRDHPGTPWAARAEIELARGFGVELVEVYDAPRPPLPPGVVPIPIPNL
jgi:hypothetical protein